ncbi:MAG: PAS domain S-box protein [Verrucomicrobia bacterium]|nr:PAS domain S-box protein [Verrucomicrobiota bacterium]
MRISRGNIQRVAAPSTRQIRDEGEKDRRLVEFELEQTRLHAQIRLLQQQQKALTESRDQYASHYEHSPIGYVTFDQKTNILDLNVAATNLVGRNRDHLLHTPFTLLVARGHTESFLKHQARCKVAHDEQVISNIRLQCQSGETVPVQLVSIVFFNKEQRLYQTALIDLTEQKKNERALAEAKEFAESVVDTMREPLIVLDADLKVISVNRAFTETFNKSPRVAKGRQFDVLLNLWWSGNKARNELEKVLLKNTTLENLELEVEPKDVGRRVLLLNARRLYQKKTLPPQILVAVQDITEEKDAAEKLKRSQAMLAEAQRLAHIGSWEWNIPKDIITGSDELYRIFGINPEAFKGTYDALLEGVHPDDRATVHSLLQAAYKNRASFDFFHRIGDSGAVRILHCSGYVVTDEIGSAVKIVGTTQDVTELKEAEERLHQLNVELEERVRARTQALQQSYQQMEAFCYSIAHDLRAPLRAMKGFGQALLEDYGTEIDIEGREYIDRIVTAADRMDQLIDDLLDYGRLNTIDLPVGKVDAEEVLCKVLTHIEPDAGVVNRKKLPIVFGHHVVLELALRNIVENALKFVAPGVTPKINIWPEQRDGAIRICVQDNGIGIAPEHQDRIFQVFQRLHTDMDYQGTGIGLAIVAKGVERIGGRVGVDSQPGKGSRFWIELPKLEATLS